MASIHDLEESIVLLIFQYYLLTESYEALAANISSVCRLWEDYCSRFSLWATYNGSLSFDAMMTKCEEGKFKKTINFKFSACDTLLTDAQVNKLFPVLSKVRVIDLSNLEHITENVLQNLTANCTQVRKIKFGNSSNPTFQPSLSHTLDTKLRHFLGRRGSNLLSIDLSYSLVENFETVIVSISKRCPNLEELHLIEVRNTHNLFPVDVIQNNCRKLKVLRLNGRVKPSDTRSRVGFRNLEVFYFHDAEKVSMGDSILENILFKSYRLKSLDISYCTISHSALDQMFSCRLQVLNLSMCYAAKAMYRAPFYPDNVRFVINWQCSLKKIDFSFAGTIFVNEAVLELCSNPTESPLEEVNVSHTEIKKHVVAEILKCSQLLVLNLESCITLDSNMAKCFNGKSELDLLSGMCSISRKK